MTTHQNTIKELLSIAIRAPSTHNSQPWCFRIGENYCDVLLDETKKLPYGDPHGHYAHISCGMVIEGFRIAAQAAGYTVTLETTHDALTRIHIKKGYLTTQSDMQLVNALKTRYNPRGAFDSTPVNEHTIAVLNTVPTSMGEPTVHISCITDETTRAAFAQATYDGVKGAHANPLFRKEIAHWMKNSFRPGTEGIPGFTLGMPAVLSLFVPTIIRYINMGAVLAYKSKEAVVSAPLAVLVGTDIPTPQSLVAVGRVALRSMLLLNADTYTTSIFVGGIEGGGVAQISSVTHPVQFTFVAGILQAPHRRWRYAPRYNVSEKLVQ